MEAKGVLEAALFMSSKPIMINELGKIVGVNSLGHVKELLEELQKEYSSRGIEVISTQDGWLMQVRSNVLPRVSHLTPYSDLSGGSKRTLAIVAYKEPVTQSEIIKIQGNKAYSYIKDLTKRGLVKAEKKGHTKILHLTGEFERYFGEDRKTIKERMKRMMEGGAEEEKPAPEPKAESIDEPQYLEEKKPKKSKAKTAQKDYSKQLEKALEASHSHAFEELD